MIKPGIYPDLSNEAYHADPAISRSQIMTYLDSPYKYWAHYVSTGAPPKKQTDALIFGNAFHALILEPEDWGDKYSILPEKKLLKDVGRELYDANEHRINAVKQNLSKSIILSLKDYYILTGMENALKNHETAWNLIQGGTYESSYFWEDEHSGLLCKARPDILHTNMIVDLKTCANASPRAFQFDMASYGNYIQGAMVREGVKQLTGVDIPTVINICIEKTYPYAIGIYIIDECALEYGHQKFKQALLDLKRDIAYNKFESYPIETVGLPNWAMK